MKCEQDVPFHSQGFELAQSAGTVYWSQYVATFSVVGVVGVVVAVQTFFVESQEHPDYL